MSAIPVIAIHGGAGTILRSAMNADTEARYHAALADVLRAGERILASGGRALDAVTEAVRLLEDCPLFNAATARCSRRRARTNSTRRSWTVRRSMPARSVA